MQQNISPIKAIRTGAQLREAREALGLTQGELARRCGLTGKHAWMTIQRNEKSKRIPVHTGLIVEALLQGAKLSTCAED